MTPLTDAQAALAEAYASHAQMLARTARPGATRCDIDELLSAASWGLVEAAQRFDPARGWTFRTYATHVIRGRMLDAIREEGRVNGWSKYHAQHGHAQRTRRVEWPAFTQKDGTMKAWEPSIAAPCYDEQIARRQAIAGIQIRRDRRVLVALLRGVAPKVLAKTLGVHESWISQVKRRAMADARRTYDGVVR